jgi:predicted small lipoprotein YifL
MRRLILVLSLSALAACGKKEAPAPPPPAPPAAPPAPAPISLGAVAGTWNFKTMPANNDSVLVTYTVVATADTSGWTLTFPGRKPMTLQVSVSGDSVLTSSPQYESMLKKGVKVTTNGSLHLVGDKLVGTTIAHYSVTGPDSVRTLRTEGVRAPK